MSQRTAATRWMRDTLTERNVSNVTDAHLEFFYDACEGNQRMAVDAIVSIADGKTYEPLQRKLRSANVDTAV